MLYLIRLFRFVLKKRFQQFLFSGVEQNEIKNENENKNSL
jgi:hypothetical protein